MISIDCIAVENEVAKNMYQQSELGYLIYNDPFGYADLILNDDPEEYLKKCDGLFAFRLEWTPKVLLYSTFGAFFTILTYFLTAQMRAVSIALSVYGLLWK